LSNSCLLIAIGFCHDCPWEWSQASFDRNCDVLLDIRAFRLAWSLSRSILIGMTGGLAHAVLG